MLNRFFRSKEARAKLIGAASAYLASNAILIAQDHNQIDPQRRNMSFGIGLVAGVLGTTAGRGQYIPAGEDTGVITLCLMLNMVLAKLTAPYFGGNEIRAQIQWNLMLMILCGTLAAIIQPAPTRSNPRPPESRDVQPEVSSRNEDTANSMRSRR